MKEEFFGKNLKLNFLLTRTHFFKTKSVHLSWNIFISKFIFGYRKSSFIFFFDFFSIFFFVRRALNFIESIARLGLVIFCHSPEFIEKKKYFKNFFIFNKWIKGFLTSFLFIENLEISSLPSAFISLNTRKHNEIFISEAFNLNVPTVGLVDINSFNLTAFSYLIPSNYTLENQLFYFRLFLRSYIIGYKVNLLNFFENLGLKRFRLLIENKDEEFKLGDKEKKEFSSPSLNSFSKGGGFKVLDNFGMDNFYKFKVFLLNPVTSIFKNDFLYKLKKKKHATKKRKILLKDVKFSRFQIKSMSKNYGGLNRGGISNAKTFLYPFYSKILLVRRRSRKKKKKKFKKVLLRFKSKQFCAYFVENSFDFLYKNFYTLTKRQKHSNNVKFFKKSKSFNLFLFVSIFKNLKGKFNFEFLENSFNSFINTNNNFIFSSELKSKFIFFEHLVLNSNHNLVNLVSFFFLRKSTICSLFYRESLNFLFFKFYFFFFFKKLFLKFLFDYEMKINYAFPKTSLRTQVLYVLIEKMKGITAKFLHRIIFNSFFIIKLVLLQKILKLTLSNGIFYFYMKNKKFLFLFENQFLGSLNCIFLTVFNEKLFKNFYNFKNLSRFLNKDPKNNFFKIIRHKNKVRTKLFNLIMKNYFLFNLQLKKN